MWNEHSINIFCGKYLIFTLNYVQILHRMIYNVWSLVTPIKLEQCWLGVARRQTGDSGVHCVCLHVYLFALIIVFFSKFCYVCPYAYLFALIIFLKILLSFIRCYRFFFFNSKSFQLIVHLLD